MYLCYPKFWGKYDGNRRNKLIRESIFIRSTWNNIFFCKKIFCWAALKSFKNNTAAYEKNFRLRDKNYARTAFGLLKAPKLQRLSVTVEVLRVGVMIVGIISVGVMTLSQKSNLTCSFSTKCIYNHIITCNLFSPWYSWNIAHLALNPNRSLTVS